jgi:hypothetical protein
MLKGGIAALVLSSMLAGVSFAAEHGGGDVIADLPENAKAEAGWVRAERDRANAVLAKDFAAGKNAIKAIGGDADALPGDRAASTRTQ